MNVLFSIGIGVALLSLVPQVIMSIRVMRERKEYANLPIKLNEIKSKYRTQRFYLMLIQVAAIILAIIGLML